MEGFGFREGESSRPEWDREELERQLQDKENTVKKIEEKMAEERLTVADLSVLEANKYRDLQERIQEIKVRLKKISRE